MVRKQYLCIPKRAWQSIELFRHVHSGKEKVVISHEYLYIIVHGGRDWFHCKNASDLYKMTLNPIVFHLLLPAPNSFHLSLRPVSNFMKWGSIMRTCATMWTCATVCPTEKRLNTFLVWIAEPCPMKSLCPSWIDQSSWWVWFHLFIIFSCPFHVYLCKFNYFRVHIMFDQVILSMGVSLRVCVDNTFFQLLRLIRQRVKPSCSNTHQLLHLLCCHV